MNIYDSILTFSNAFKNSEEVKEFKRLKEKIDANEANKNIVDDFHKKIYEYQLAKQNGEDVTGKEAHLNSLNQILVSNTEIAEYMAAEVRVSTIMNDIVKMLEDAIRE